MTALLDFFGTVFDVIRNFFFSTIWALKSIPTLATSLAGVYAYAPSCLQYALVLCFSITVTFGVLRMLK